MTELWERLCHLIIRPPRCQYELTDLGPKSFQLDDGKTYKRTDFQVVNARGHRLECSHWEPVQRVAMQLPCVIYCHGNCGSRLDAAEAVDCLLSYNITVVALDFSGCGRSEGEFVSLGAFEPDDIACLVEHLRASGTVSRLGLWGRSMGAVSALLYSVRDPTVAGMVLDSPFSNLSDLIVEIAQGFASKVPGFLLRLVGRIMRSSVRSRAGFDIDAVDPLRAAPQCFVPVLFAHASGDAFVRPAHSERLYRAYGGDKNIVRFPGDHNSIRPPFFYDSVAIFFYNVLLCEAVPTRAASAAPAPAAAAAARPPPPPLPPKPARWTAHQAPTGAPASAHMAPVSPVRRAAAQREMEAQLRALGGQDGGADADRVPYGDGGAEAEAEREPFEVPTPQTEEEERAMLLQALCASLREYVPHCGSAAITVELMLEQLIIAVFSARPAPMTPQEEQEMIERIKRLSMLPP